MYINLSIGKLMSFRKYILLDILCVKEYILKRSLIFANFSKGWTLFYVKYMRGITTTR